MKKLLFILLISILYVACTGGQSSDKNVTDSTSSVAAGPSVTMPYTAGYSSSFTIGKQRDVLTVLNWYKAWETGDMTALASAFADSLTMHFSDGSSMDGKTDSLMVMAKKFRDSLSSVKINVDAWIPVHSTDKNEDWVLVWYKEVDVFKNGKKDSVYYEDDNLIDKNGKIRLVDSHKQDYKK